MSEHHEGSRPGGAEPSEEAVFETANALLRMHEDGQNEDIRCPDEIPGRLHYHGYLVQRPHYQVVLAAMTEAGIGHMLWGHVRTGEDLLRKYVYEERMREVRQRREVSARRRRDFEQRGLSAEESDRLARYLSSVGSGQGGRFLTLVLPKGWEPPQITKEEAEEVYWEFRRKENANYLRSLEEWRQSSPKDRRRYPEPRPPVDDDRVDTLKMLLYWREEERREEEHKEMRQEMRQRLTDIRSPEDLRAYEQEFASGALSS